MLHCRCDAVLMSTTSTNLDLLLVTVFSAHIREKYLKVGIYLIDDVLKLFVPNSSIEYPFKDCFMLLFPGVPLNDTEMEIPESFEHTICGYARLPLKNY